jgi:UDP-GlcNAc:undecaprenyl-phosphate GlcNAc-1-phosphate transferase
MGDSGALFLGFVLAGIAMGHGYTQVNIVALCAPLLILGVPLYDTALVMVLRFLKGRSMFRGSNDHLALRFRFLGYSVKQIVWALWILSAILAASAGFLVRFSEKRALVFMIFFSLAALVFTFAVSNIQIDEGKESIRENPFRIFLPDASTPASKNKKSVKPQKEPRASRKTR